MKFNDAGLKTIQDFEGLRLSSYWDVDHWAIGYGCGHHVTEGMVISQDEAVERLKEDIKEVSDAVSKMILPTQINNNQFSACVSLAYNIGIGQFKTSTLLYNIKMGHANTAAPEFLKWNKINGSVSEGLSRRREAEKDLYLSDVSV